MKMLNKFLMIFSLVFILILTTACTDNTNSDAIETKTIIDVPKPTTTTTLQPAEATITCRAKQYDMDLKLDTERKQLNGTLVIQLINETKDTLNELCIRTDAAAMEMQNIMIVGTNETLGIKEKQDTSVIYVDISNTPLYSGESISIKLDFETKIPEQESRFGYTVNGNDTIYQLSFCFPRIAMYEDGVWDESPYIDGSGENNYVTVSDYHVTFDAPEEFTVIASGEEKTNGNKTDIIGENLRQLAIFAGTNIKVDTEIVHDVAINNYYFNHDGNMEYYAMAMEAAKDSFNLFTTLIGKYPYQELDMVHGCFPSAMEYSGVILIGLPDVGKKFITKLDKHASFGQLCSTTAHEVAHQWFYGVVGNDPYDEAWLDEALAEYCENMLYQQSKLPSIATAVKHDQAINEASLWGTMSDKEFNEFTELSIEQITGDSFIINKPYDAYNTDDYEYSSHVYDGGSYFLYELQKAIGDGVFFPMLQEYYKAYYFNECTTEDFVNMVRTFDNSKKVGQILKKYIQ